MRRRPVSGRVIITICRTRIRFNADAAVRNEIGPPHMVNQVDVLNDLDLRLGALEQGDAGSGIVIARWLKHPIEQWQSILSE